MDIMAIFRIAFPGLKTSTMKEEAKLAKEAIENDSDVMYFAGYRNMVPGPNTMQWWVQHVPGGKDIYVLGPALIYSSGYGIYNKSSWAVFGKKKGWAALGRNPIGEAGRIIAGIKLQEYKPGDVLYDEDYGRMGLTANNGWIWNKRHRLEWVGKEKAMKYARKI